MNKSTKRVLLILSLILLGVLSGCSQENKTQFVCSDGSTVSSSDSCPLEEIDIEEEVDYDDIELIEKSGDYFKELGDDSDFSKNGIETAVNLNSCAYRDFCYDFDDNFKTFEEFLSLYNEHLSFGIEKMKAYNNRFESYTVSEEYSEYQKHLITNTEDYIEWYEDIQELIANGDYTGDTVYDIDSFETWRSSMSIIEEEYPEMRQKLELNSI
ncbi:hypothetical protein J4477_00035 [Candidatus Pacearchaeota archaeon]|nr:hypothetical protein [Candidatus Pacearchaeota archaeon]